MKKRCATCNLEKVLSTDNFYQRESGSFDPYCRDCDSKRAQVYYNKNKQKSISGATIRREKRRAKSRNYYLEYLSNHHCVDCGESNILTLEFDHIDPTTKKYTISWMICQGISLEKVKQEILKCEVRCANCHKIKTAKQQNWYKYLVLGN